MSFELSKEDLALQFLVQEVLQDLGRYYERSHQRSLYRESLEGVKRDIEDRVISKYATPEDPAYEELDGIIEAVKDQLARSNGQDTVKIKAYLDVFDEWCRAQLETAGDEILDAGTENKPEAQKWLDQVLENVRSVQPEQVDRNLHQAYQNQLTDRWNEIMEGLTED